LALQVRAPLPLLAFPAIVCFADKPASLQ